MKILLTSLFALLSLNYAFANPPTTIKKTLSWQEKANVHPFQDSEETIEVWRFDGAIFSNERPTLPLFQRRLLLDGNFDVQAVFTNTQFESFDKAPSPDDAFLSENVLINISVEKDRQDYFARLSFVPIRKNASGYFERLVSFEIRLIYTARPEPIKPRGGNTYTSVLSDGDVYKFAVSKTGVYKLTFDFLKNSLNIPLENVDPRNIKIYGNGGGMLPELAGAERADDLVENAIEVSGEGDGKFDAGDFILFYAQGPTKSYFDEQTKTFYSPANIYDTKNYYFIKINGGQGLRIQNQASLTGASYTSTAFNDHIRYEEDKLNLLHEFVFGQGSGQQWFGDYFKVQTQKDYSDKFQVANLVTDVPARLTAVFAGRMRGSNGRFSITANGNTYNSDTFTPTSGGSTDLFATVRSISKEFVPNSGQFNIGLNFSKTDQIFDEGWLDYIELNFRRQLLMTGNQMIFRDLESKGNAVSNFRLGNATGNVTVWDITEPLSPKRQEAVLSGSELSFGAATPTVKEFIAFSDFLSAEAVGKIENQNIHALSDIEVAIVAHADFLTEAQRLADHRSQHSNVKVAVVDVEKLYNEFSSGRKDAAAIRDFAKMVYDRNPENFRSLILFGDGSFDGRNIYKLGGDFVPPYETIYSLSPISSYPTDDFFGLLGDTEGGNISTGSLELGIGRFPVKDIDEARATVDKVIKYDTDPGALRDWRNRIVFMGDDEDGNTHTRDADNISKVVEGKNSNLNLDKVYLDAFPQVSTPGGTRIPLATDAINNDIFKGVLAMVYLGHGGTKGLAQERVLKTEDILSWRNLERLPLIITATCSFAGFDNPAFTAAGELAFLNDKGGAIALFTTVRPVFAHANADLTEAAVDTLFYKFNHQIPTIGEVMRLSKNNGKVDLSNSRRFTLLGDPSMQLALPNHQVVTTKVNGKDISAGIIDTIRALQKVTIEGQVEDDFGNLISDFNGVVYPTIFDKVVKYQTLAQDAGSPLFNFDLQKNVIFKGRASVLNGKFSFTFVVPKDIDYSYGACKVSYYVADEVKHQDGAGNYQAIIVGGTDQSALTDDRGPKVEVFMNDENFVFGGMTNPDPVLLVKLEDDNGINVVGNSIGHDLSGILDKNTQSTYTLNDFYEAALDDYTKGEVRYPLSSLAEGRHEIKVNAWDIANNPAEGFTEFVVVTSEEVALKYVLNYPNPFTTSTCFMFEHNQSGAELDVMVQIYTISGKLIKTLEERIISEGYRLGSGNCIKWDARDDYGDPLAKGVYLYKVKIRNVSSGDLKLEGESEFEKMVILK